MLSTKSCVARDLPRMRRSNGMVYPDMWWLNVTNIAMGVGVLLCGLAVACGLVQGILKKRY